MQVIVRHHFRIEAQLRLDHLHNRHYAGRRRSDLIFDHRHNAVMRAALADATDAELDVPQADVTPADTGAGRS